MPFDYQTNFPAQDSNCVSKFARLFQHLDWIDGESLVQAEETPGVEKGFNKRFHEIERDLDLLGDDAKQAFLCVTQMRGSLRSLLDEIRTELNRLSQQGSGWQTATLLNGWAFKSLDTNFDYEPPAYFKDSSGIVHFRGTLGGGVVQNFRSVMFRLPPAYHPGARRVLRGLTSGDKVVRIDVDNQQGDVILRTDYNLWVSLDGMHFG